MPAKLLTENDIDSVMKANFNGSVLLQAALLMKKKVKKILQLSSSLLSWRITLAQETLTFVESFFADKEWDMTSIETWNIGILINS